METTAQGKWVIYDIETGERLERWPIDAKGMIAVGSHSTAPPVTVTSERRLLVETTAERKWVIYDIETGERLERWPIVAKGMIAVGSHSTAPPEIVTSERKPPDGKRSRGSAQENRDKLERFTGPFRRHRLLWPFTILILMLGIVGDAVSGLSFLQAVWRFLVSVVQ